MAKYKWEKKAKTIAAPVAEATVVERPVLSYEELSEEERRKLIGSAEWGSEFTDALLVASVRGKEDVESICDFAELVFNIIPPRHMRQWFTEILATKRVAIVAPPESAKTTASIVLIAWWIGKYPHLTNVVASAGDSLAQRIASTIVHVIEFSPKWKKVFPNVIPDKAKGWSREGWDVIDSAQSADDWGKLTATKKDPTLLAGGVGSAVINGTRVSGILLGDDLHDRKSKDSDVVCQDVVSFVKDTFLRRATTSAHVVFNQTRWSPSDVIGWLGSIADSEYAVKIFTHPALNEDGTSYWPKNWPLSRLNAERNGMTEAEWQLVFMGNAEAARGTILKAEALRNFPHANILHTWQHYLGVDMALKMQELTKRDEREHSEFAVSVLAYSGNLLVLVDGIASILYFGEAENSFFQFCDIWRPVRVGFEVNAQNRLYYNNFVRRKLESGYHWLNIVPITTTANMASRMGEMEPDFRNGAIQVSDEPLPFLKKFRDQWLGFGGKGIKNDTLSSTHLARQVAYNLLPRESAGDQQRRRAARAPLSIGRAIEAAYGVR